MTEGVRPQGREETVEHVPQELRRRITIQTGDVAAEHRALRGRPGSGRASYWAAR